MSAFLAAVAAAIVIAIGASAILERYQSTADRAYVGSGARPDLEPKLSADKPKPKS